MEFSLMNDIFQRKNIYGFVAFVWFFVRGVRDASKDRMRKRIVWI